MTNTATQMPLVALLQGIYKNVKKAEDTLIDLLPRVKDEALRNAFTVAFSGYEDFAARASRLLAEVGEEPLREGVMTQMTAKMGVMMRTVRDRGTRHLAKMVIERTTAGMDDLHRQIRLAEARGASGKSLDLARRLYEF